MRTCCCGHVNVNINSTSCAACGRRLPQSQLRGNQPELVRTAVEALGGVTEGPLWSLPSWKTSQGLHSWEVVIAAVLSHRLNRFHAAFSPYQPGYSPISFSWFRSSKGGRKALTLSNGSVLFANTRLLYVANLTTSLWYEDIRAVDINSPKRVITVSMVGPQGEEEISLRWKCEHDYLPWWSRFARNFERFGRANRQHAHFSALMHLNQLFDPLCEVGNGSINRMSLAQVS